MRYWQTEALPQDGDPPADAIPPMQRRRMSRLSKMALTVAMDAAGEWPVDYTIFSSQHGEIVRTRGILRSLCEGTEVSPAAFAQSVHNTSSGLYSIAAKATCPSTSIAAGRNSFACAWLEAQAYLATNPGHRVLLVDFDEAIPVEYQQYSDVAYCDHALAMVLAPAAEEGIDLVSIGCPDEQPRLPFGPQFLAWMLSERETLVLGADGQGWSWAR